MKQIFVLVAVLGIFGSLSEAIDEEFIQNVIKKMQQIGQECMKETGATDDDIGDILQRKTPATKEGKCLVNCFGIHLGFTDAAGNYNKEGVKATFEPLKQFGEDTYNKVVKIFNDCSTEVVKTDDLCETAAAYFQCCLRKEREDGLEEGALPF